MLYYTALLAYVGCHVDAHEQAKWFGDDLVAKADARMFDFDGGRSDVAYLIGHLGAGRPPLERLRLGMAFLSGAGRRAAGAMFDNHWLATAGLARALQLGDPVLDQGGLRARLALERARQADRRHRVLPAPALHVRARGRMRVLMDDGDEVELRAGDVAAIPPGHDAEVLGDEPCITVDLGEEDADYAKRA